MENIENKILNYLMYYENKGIIEGIDFDAFYMYYIFLDKKYNIKYLNIFLKQRYLNELNKNKNKISLSEYERDIEEKSDEYEDFSAKIKEYSFLLNEEEISILKKLNLGYKISEIGKKSRIYNYINSIKIKIKEFNNTFLIL